MDAVTSDLNMPAAQATFRRGMTRWQLRRVLDYIELNLASKLMIAELASLVALSDSHFSRGFRHVLGCPPMAYVALKRVEHAKLMMRLTTEPLCNIAIACGFADQPHFNKTFRRRVGVSPGAWRRAAQALRGSR